MDIPAFLPDVRGGPPGWYGLVGQDVGLALDCRIVLTSAGESRLPAALTASATMPATCGTAMEVPYSQPKSILRHWSKVALRQLGVFGVQSYSYSCYTIHVIHTPSTKMAHSKSYRNLNSCNTINMVEAKGKWALDASIQK